MYSNWSNRLRHMRVSSEDALETVELRVGTVEPPREKDRDMPMTSTSAFARAAVCSGSSLATCSSSSRATASTRPHGESMAEASTANLRFRLNRHD